jgi:ATP-dependent Lon protease
LKNTQHLKSEIRDKLKLNQQVKRLSQASVIMLERLEILKTQMPNLANAINDIISILAVSVSAHAPIRLFPILLVGDPGIGKTYFVEQLAEIFGLHAEIIDMASTTAGFVIGGADSSWSDAKPGRVYQALADSYYANPIIILDEIDKAGTNDRHDPLGPLYKLLEQGSAKSFQDEYFCSVKFDASHIIWFATANSIDGIPHAVVSRFSIVEIPSPTIDEKAIIAKRAVVKLLTEMGWNKAIQHNISDGVAYALAETKDLRSMRDHITKACGRAVEAGRNKIEVDDVCIETVSKKKFGFIG